VNIWQILSYFRHWRAFFAVVLAVVLACTSMTGCATTPQQNPYMLTGAGLGAALGAALGVASSPGNPWRGAAIGGLLGTAAGGIAGEWYGRSAYPYGNTYPSGRPYGGYYSPPPNPNYGYAPQSGTGSPPAGGYYSQAPSQPYESRPPNTAEYRN